MTVQIEIPEEFLKRYNISDISTVQNLILIGLRQTRIEEALSLYKKGLVSLWRSADIAGISLREMTYQAVAYGCRPVYDDAMLKEELQ